MSNKPDADATRTTRCKSALIELSNHHAEGKAEEHHRHEHRHENNRNIGEGILITEQIEGGGVWVFRTVCFERVVLSSPGCLWPGRMDDHEEVLEAHA